MRFWLSRYYINIYFKNNNDDDGDDHDADKWLLDYIFLYEKNHVIWYGHHM